MQKRHGVSNQSVTIRGGTHRACDKTNFPRLADGDYMYVHYVLGMREYHVIKPCMIVV